MTEKYQNDHYAQYWDLGSNVGHYDGSDQIRYAFYRVSEHMLQRR